MIRAYKYRLLPTQEQSQQLNYWRKQTARVWNIGLRYLMDSTPHYMAIAEYNAGIRAGKQGAGFYRFKKIGALSLYSELFTGGKQPWAKGWTYFITPTLNDLVLAWEMCLNGMKRRACPHFKKGDGPLRLSGTNAKDIKRQNEGRKGYIVPQSFLKTGPIRYVHHRDVGKHKQVSITCDDARNEWWVSLVVDVDAKKISNKKDIAIDIGINSIVADSDGRTVKGAVVNGRLMNGKRHKVSGNARANIKPSKLAEIQGRLSKLKKNGSRYRKLEKRLLKNRLEIVNRQRFHEFRLANYYGVYQNVVMEDFKPGNLIGGSKKLNRNMRMLRLGSLMETIRNKTEEYGNVFSVVPAQYNSQRCMKCGHQAKENRTGVIFKCVSCGYVADADVNGAQNALEKFRNGKIKKKKKVMNTSSKMRNSKIALTPISKSTDGAVAQPGQIGDDLLKLSGDKGTDSEMPEVTDMVQNTMSVASTKEVETSPRLLVSENSCGITRLSHSEESGNVNQYANINRCSQDGG